MRQWCAVFGSHREQVRQVYTIEPTLFPYTTLFRSDSSFDGHDIREGDFMAMLEGKLLCASRRFEDVLLKLARAMCSKKSQFITVFAGEGADPKQAQFVCDSFGKEAKNAEVSLMDGGQPVYSYVISVE